jgi:hypothetical protein
MAGDHGDVHVVESKTVWDEKIQDSKRLGKVVSAFSFFLSLKLACPSPPLQLTIVSFHSCSW